MTHGFIDPDAHTRDRLDRIDVLISEALSQLDVSALSPEAQAILADLNSEQEVRVERARRHMARLMEADPLPEPDSPASDERPS